MSRSFTVTAGITSEPIKIQVVLMIKLLLKVYTNRYSPRNPPREPPWACCIQKNLSLTNTTTEIRFLWLEGPSGRPHTPSYSHAKPKLALMPSSNCDFFHCLFSVMLVYFIKQSAAAECVRTPHNKLKTPLGTRKWNCVITESGDPELSCRLLLLRNNRV